MSLSNSRSGRFWLLAIFVLSGFAGLIYQSIWSHYLGLFLGHAAYAQALVLAIFMGGMAIGAAWIAKAGERRRNLIRGYAVIEAVIGLLGLLFHWLFTHVVSFSYGTLIPALGSPLSVNVARWAIAATLILPQTILLGMTFPLMSGGLIRRFPDSQGNLLGGLYFTNSIGAALGALTAVFVLLPWVGLPGAMVAASVLNFAVAALAWLLAGETEPLPREVRDAPAAPKQSLRHNTLLRLVLLGTALSGAASFAYEIIWIRMLSMAVGSTMHAFELMLTSFIAGIALGGLWVRKRADSNDMPLRLVGWMQIFMGIAALMSLAVYANAFAWVGWLMGALAKTDGGYALFNLGTAAIAMAIMLPAAFFAGTTLPLFTVALLRDGQGERAIGRVYAWNTLGSIAGVLAAIHLLIPALGLKLALCLAALVDIAIGLVLLRWQADSQRAMLRFGLAALIAAVALVVGIRIPWDTTRLASGVFRHGNAMVDPGSKVVFMRDGKTASVSVTAHPWGTVVIATNGKPDAGLRMDESAAPSPDEPTMVMLGALPLALHEMPKRAGVIGFGSGLTTHTLLGDKRLQQVDTVEIEPVMVEGAKVYGKRVARAYEDPRSRIVIDDAKAHFAAQKEKYDLIISEPSNPWISGVGALFTKEFYQQVPSLLNKGGLFVQWIHLYEIDEPLIGSILNALTPAFKNYSAWLANNSDLLIVASPDGQVGEPDFQKLANGPLATDLERIGITSAEHLNLRKVADTRVLRALGRLYEGMPVNSDYFPVLGLQAPKTRFKGMDAGTLRALPDDGPPLLEALGIRKPLSEKASPSMLTLYTPDMSTRNAHALLRRLRGEQLEPATVKDLNLDWLNLPVLLQDAAPTCGQPWSASQQQAFAHNLHLLAERTITFLPASLLQSVWIRPTWLRCPQALPPDFTRVFALLESVAQRDYERMEQGAQEWFGNPPANITVRREFDQLALSNLLLALAHKADWQGVLQAESKYGDSVRPSGIYLMQRMLLKAMAND
jgi:predicted membrane-bound spermidine synthase